MGLDCSVYKTKERPTSRTDFNFPCHYQEIAYWRKFNNLQGWMHSLYTGKGGEEEDFNGCNTILFEEDLIRLSDEIKDAPPTTGFFFGSQCGVDDELVEEVKEFCVEGVRLIKEGWYIFYNGDY